MIGDTYEEYCARVTEVGLVPFSLEAWQAFQARDAETLARADRLTERYGRGCYFETYDPFEKVTWNVQVLSLADHLDFDTAILSDDTVLIPSVGRYLELGPYVTYNVKKQAVRD